jgi:cold-inducible RNA-binding protein
VYVTNGIQVPHRTASIVHLPSWPEQRPLSDATLKAKQPVEHAIDRRHAMGRKLYVGNLGYDISDADLEQLLHQHGTVQSAQVITDKMTGRSKGFGFVEMSSDEEAQTAIQALNGKDYGGRTLTVSEARPRESRESRGGASRGYGKRRY